jgi:RNA polymerase sigma factor (sigma-70 family)
MTQQTNSMTFEEAVLPHLDAAYNLARWLTRNKQDAEDVVQEAYLRAFRFFGGFHGGNSRTWLLTIVRNTCYTWLHQNRAGQPAAFDEQVHTDTAQSQSPETLLLRKADGQLLNHALEELPAAFREVLVLLELEGLSYKEIAEILGIPIGTVMSRLARARHRLRELLSGHFSNTEALESKSENRPDLRDLQPGEEPVHAGEALSETEFTDRNSESSDSISKR